MKNRRVVHRSRKPCTLVTVLDYNSVPFVSIIGLGTFLASYKDSTHASSSKLEIVQWPLRGPLQHGRSVRIQDLPFGWKGRGRNSKVFLGGNKYP